MNSTMRHPSAWVPIALSLAMLAFLLTYLAMYGVPVADVNCIGTCGRPDVNADEGTPAHLFQLWLVLEVFMISFFAFKWLPQAPKQALAVLAVQIIAALAACFPVFYLEL